MSSKEFFIENIENENFLIAVELKKLTLSSIKNLSTTLKRQGVSELTREQVINRLLEIYHQQHSLDKWQWKKRKII